MEQYFHLRKFVYLMVTIFLMVTTVSCSLDDSLKGEYAGVDDELPTLDFTSPISTDKVTYWNQEAFAVTGTCFQRGRSIRIWATGAEADDVICQDDKSFTASLNFKNPGIADGMITIYGKYSNSSAATSQESLTIAKETYPYVFLEASTSATEGSDLILAITLDHAGDEAFSFEWTTSDGTALAADSDYSSVSSQVLTVAAGQTNINLTIATGADSVYELDETLTVVLENPTLSYLKQTSANLTISNNDSMPSIFIYDATGNEGETLSFLVSLSSASGVNVDFTYSSTNGTAVASGDYTAVSSSGQIAQSFLMTTILVVSGNDGVYENSESFLVSLSDSTHAQVLSSGVDE